MTEKLPDSPKTNVIPLKDKKKKTEDKLPLIQIFVHIANAMDNEENYKASRLASHPFPLSLKVFRPVETTEECIFQEVERDLGQGKRGKVLIKTSMERVTTELVRYLGSITCGGFEAYHLENRTASRAVRHWMDTTDPLTTAPKPVAFLDDPDPCFVRLPFNPVFGVASKAPHLCPDWLRILARMTNASAFVARLGSIFDPSADRKQAIYLWGKPDCGKSQIMSLLERMCGTSYISLSNSSLDTDWWQSMLLGKRVCCITEATDKFINTEEFKSITGDKNHTVNEKKGRMFTAEINSLFFFFSNNPPTIQGKESLINRIIPCYLEELPKNTALLPEHEYQSLLFEQLPFFLGLCIETWNDIKKTSVRIPCDQSKLFDAIDQREEFEVCAFESLFREDPDKAIPISEVYHAISMEYQKLKQWEIDRIVAVWCERYKLSRQRVYLCDGNGNTKQVRCLVGLSYATLEEKMTKQF